MIKQNQREEVGHFEIFKTLFAGLFLVTVASMTSYIYSDDKRSEQTKTLSSPSNSSVINTEATKTPVPGTKAGAQTNKAVQPSPSPTSDYTKCNISAKCGGGYKVMLKTTCDEMVCCTYSLDYPSIYTSRSDCENRLKMYIAPGLTPDWEYQSSFVVASPNTSREAENIAFRQQLIDECKQRVQKLKEDMLALCPIYNGQQDSTCVARAQVSYENCDDIK